MSEGCLWGVWEANIEWSREYVMMSGSLWSKSLISLDASRKGRECQYDVHTAHVDTWVMSKVYDGKQQRHNGHWDWLHAGDLRKASFICYTSESQCDIYIFLILLIYTQCINYTSNIYSSQQPIWYFTIQVWKGGKTIHTEQLIHGQEGFIKPAGNVRQRIDAAFRSSFVYTLQNTFIYCLFFG